MNLRPRSSSSRASLLLLLTLPLLTPRPVRATGFEEPERWFDQERKIVLEAPEFFFAEEAKILAAELKAMPKAVPPTPDAEGAPAYEKQTTDTDLAEFAEALKTGAIQPPDPAGATAAHAAARARIDGTGTDEREEFASEFADYHRGALAFPDDPKTVKTAWEALLARPPGERHFRTTWAAYMLGKMAIEEKDFDTARTRFREARKAAQSGFADGLGLAAASLGWEGYAELHSDHLAEAAQLYLEQLATGDETAVDSLRAVLSAVFERDDADLAEIARQPILQRLVTAEALSGIAPLIPEYDPSGKRETEALKWLAALEKAKALDVRDADRLAWIAYGHGEYARAERWLKRASPNAPYAHFLKAKLALRAGNVKAGAELLAQGVRRIPAGVISDRARGDFGLLRVGRGEFVEALRTFVEGGQVEDATYVAEALLTIEELKKLVDGEFLVTPELVEKAANLPWKDHEQRRIEAARIFRDLLARRYARGGRPAEARPYFDEALHAAVDEYAALLKQMNQPGRSKSEQAKALWETAQFVESSGSELLDFSYPVEMAARLSGREVSTGEYPIIAMTFGKVDKFVPPVGGEERARMKKNLTPTLKRHYSAYAACDLAWRAAVLMPDDQEQTARVLNIAGHWLKAADDDAADRFYQALEQRCAKTATGKAAIKIHWFPPLPESPDPDEKPVVR